MRIAWFSPLPPIPSGIGDYSFELLPLMAEEARIDVICPHGPLGRRLRVPEGVGLIRPEAFPRVAGRYDAVFHHLGNNPHHRFVYESALAHPGIAVFHDAVLHHLIAHLYAERTSPAWPRYDRILRGEYGEVGGRLMALRSRGVATDVEKFLFPLTGHVARRSRRLVAHSLDVRDRLLEVAPGVPVDVIPHHAGTPPPAVRGVGRAEARRRLGLPGADFLVGQFGFITKPKQPADVLGGFAAFLERRPEATLLLVGENQTPGRGLERLIRDLGLGGRVRAIGYVDLPTFYLYLRAVDAVVNLRYPSAGEASGTFARSLAEGRATIVSDLGSFSEIPADVALQVEVDGDQRAQMARHLVRLAEDPPFRARVEEAARSYASTVLDQRRCARLYLDAAARAAGAAVVPQRAGR